MPPADAPTHDAPLPAASSLPVTVIQRRPGWQAIDLSELWRYRELLFFFTWRDVKVKYKQTVLGIAWTVLQPVVNMTIFAVVFGRLVGLADATKGVPYPIFVFSGLIPWTLFAAAMNSAGNSLVSESHIITKIYFPRLIIPLSSVGAALVDFSVACVVLLLVMLGYGVFPDLRILLLPAFLGLLLVTSMSVGVAVAALSVAYRDFRYLVPFSIQCLFYLTPVIYPVSLIPNRFQWIAKLNPMASVVDGFRYCLIGQPLDWPLVGWSAALAGGVLVASIFYFRRIESTFADII